MGERADIMAAGEDKQYDELLKILVVGESAVGKTQLVTRYTEDAFTDSGHATIGVDFKIKKTEIQSGDFKGTKLKLQIWDTAGQERFRNVNSSYYRGTRTPKARWKWVFVHVHRQQNRLGGRAEGFERR